MNRALKRLLLVLITLLLVSVRVYHLNADPPPWLSWSTGIYTDEGVYANDARSVVLFGHWAPGDFHSAVIAPLHHLILLVLFKSFGVSLLSARALSVGASLLSLLFFYLALKRQYGDGTAMVGLMFLGLSPVVVFYNRLALLETPTVFFLCFALYLGTFRKHGWAIGVVLALAVVYKPLALLCIPAYFTEHRRDLHPARQKAIAFALSLVFYFLAWQLPYRKDLSRLNKFYLFHQYLPHSAGGILTNVERSLWTGAGDGILPYLIFHAPLLIVLAPAAACILRLRRKRNLRMYALWLAIPVFAFVFVSYDPSRYFLLFWPALAAISAITVMQLRDAWRIIAVGTFVLYSSIAIGESLWSPSYAIENSGRSLGREEPQNELLIGQYAPEFALSNRLHCLYIQPGLANSTGNLGPGLVLIDESPFWSEYWDNRLTGVLVQPATVRFELPHDQTVRAVSI